MKDTLKDTFEYDDIEYNGKSYHVAGRAWGTYTYIKGRDYMPNGDPGYPSESDFEVTDVDLEYCYEIGSDGEDCDEQCECPKEVLDCIYERLGETDVGNWTVLD